MIVVDTNVIGYFFLASAHSAQVDEVFRIDPAWAAPLLWRSEFHHILFGYLRKQIITLEEAHQIMQQATLTMAGREYAVNSLEVLRLAGKSSCSAYDCEFVVLADELGIPLVTVDRKILKAFPETAVSLESFISDR